MSCSRTQHSDAGEAQPVAPQSQVKHSTTEPLNSGIQKSCRAYPGSEFVVANTLAKWEKLEPNEINFSQGFSQKVVSTSCFVLNSLPARGDFFVC